VKEFLSSQASTHDIIMAITITACIVASLLLYEKMSRLLAKMREKNYIRKNGLEINSTVFYKNEYWVIMRYLEEEKSYSIMPLKSKKTNTVKAKDLIKGSISQEKLLNALASADTFTEFYSGNEHLLKKYLDDA